MIKYILFLSLTVMISLPAMSQAGSPDNSFGTNGRLNIPMGAFDDFAHAVAVQADGKIVIAGYSRITEIGSGNRHDFSIARLNPDGTLDNSFDADGKVIVPVGDFGGFAYAVKIQPDGKILVAGAAINTNDQDYVVVRLNGDGSLDN
ncbi:MAG TPA: delta-60 repeat domain-containing protein, partial [Chitinophagaceae bacterium]